MSNVKSIIIDGVEYIPKSKTIETENEYIFIIDVSGSIPMKKYLQTLEQTLSGLQLQGNNKFNILTFPVSVYDTNKDSIKVFAESESLSKENITKAIHLMNIIGRPKGGSELLPAIKKATKLPILEGYERICIIITDGYINELV